MFLPFFNQFRKNDLSVFPIFVYANTPPYAQHLSDRWAFAGPSTHGHGPYLLVATSTVVSTANYAN